MNGWQIAGLIFIGIGIVFGIVALATSTMYYFAPAALCALVGAAMLIFGPSLKRWFRLVGGTTDPSER